MSISIPLSIRGKNSGKYETIVDNIDEIFVEFNWSFVRGYAVRHVQIDKMSRVIHLHREILSRVLDRELFKNEQVDHINGNGLDNRRSNLRLATSNQNKANAKKRKDNLSGFKGVSFNKNTGRWVARIQHDNINHSLGAFDSPEDAHNAYKAKALELCGEFANDGVVSLASTSLIEMPKMPKRLHPKNKTGITGICFKNDKNLYEIYSSGKGKRKYIGTAKTLELAIETLDKYKNTNSNG